MSERLQIWVVTDGRAGNRAQAMGLAEAIGRLCPADIAERPVELKRWAAAVPPRVSWLLTGLAGWPFAGLSGAAFGPPWPDLVIGAGRRSAPVVAALRRQHASRAVQLLSPQMPASAFDAVVVPGHDSLSGENVINSIGALNRLTPATIANAARDWTDTFAALPAPRVAVLVGGPSRSSGFDRADGDRLIEALKVLARTHSLMITPSRRTPPDLAVALTGLGPATWSWSGDGANPYPGLLGHADAVLVTEDSVNMASEAATTGLPVHVFPVTRPARKIIRFHETLTERGASRRFVGTVQTWTYAPLAETDRIAAELIARRIAVA